MALQTRLVQKMSQSLLMTPQLQQAIKLLQLGRLEYIEALQNELLENPILEELKEKEGNNSQSSDKESHEDRDVELKSSEDNANSPVNWEDYLSSFSDYRGTANNKGSIDFSEQPSIEATLTKIETLNDHVIEQLRLSEIEDSDQPIVLQILGNLDKNGYLRVPYEEIAESCSCTLEDVQRVIDIFKLLDPVGLGARNLKECLLFQLENLGIVNSLAGKLVKNHLDKLERRKYEQIAKEENVDLDTVYQAVLTIQSLEPRPGRHFIDEEIRYVIPDIYIRKISGEWVITLNEDGLPKLRVSPYYLELLRNNENSNQQNKEYLNDRLKAASWLIKSIHQRQQTIYKVTESIVKFQQDFLESGVQHLKPMVLKNVAEDIGMHESTVSRVTTNKYVHTPQGVFELKYFFTTGLKTSGGDDVSSSSIKEKIKQIIASEKAEKPISDQKIVDHLKTQKISIARRTVAKYRESLGIPPSSKRKKLF